MQKAVGRQVFQRFVHGLGQTKFVHLFASFLTGGRILGVRTAAGCADQTARIGRRKFLANLFQNVFVPFDLSVGVQQLFAVFVRFRWPAEQKQKL